MSGMDESQKMTDCTLQEPELSNIESEVHLVGKLEPGAHEALNGTSKDYFHTMLRRTGLEDTVPEELIDEEYKGNVRMRLRVVPNVAGGETTEIIEVVEKVRLRYLDLIVSQRPYDLRFTHKRETRLKPDHPLYPTSRRLSTRRKRTWSKVCEKDPYFRIDMSEVTHSPSGRITYEIEVENHRFAAMALLPSKQIVTRMFRIAGEMLLADSSRPIKFLLFPVDLPRMAFSSSGTAVAKPLPNAKTDAANATFVPGGGNLLLAPVAPTPSLMPPISTDSTDSTDPTNSADVFSVPRPYKQIKRENATVEKLSTSQAILTLEDDVSTSLTNSNGNLQHKDSQDSKSSTLSTTETKPEEIDVIGYDW